jgi:hypothetical protein
MVKLRKSTIAQRKSMYQKFIANTIFYLLNILYFVETSSKKSKLAKTNSTVQLRRSERIKNILIKKQGKKVSVVVSDVLVEKNITKTIVKPKALSKNISNTSNKDENVIKIREKFYNQIGRDEMYRDKINQNPNVYNKDKHGNLSGNQFDLAMDNAFNGFIISVLQLYNEGSFNFKDPTKSLEVKGFKVHRWTTLPPITEFNDLLMRSCQFWLISGSYNVLTNDHFDMIKKFFDSGKGVYIWGDNDPYYADANKLSKNLFGAEMSGNDIGGLTVNIQKEPKKSGLVVENIINTGVDFLFEGHTIAKISDNVDLEPVMYGSANNLVVASYNKDGKRAIIDGGFTRLYCNWNSAGTGRYVMNAAAWLANIENIPI